MRMTTFCSIGGHFVAFAGIMAGGQLQQEISKAAPNHIEPLVSFAFCLCVVLFLVAGSFANWFMWRKQLLNDDLNEAVNHLETDILGLLVSFLITQSIRHAIDGEYPEMQHHVLLQGQFKVSVQIHPQWQCMFMLGWSVALTIVASISLPILDQYKQRSEFTRNLIRFFKVLLIMLVAWGYLLWGQWEFYERLFQGDALFGHMVFAVAATIACLGILYIIASVQSRIVNPRLVETNRITVTGISLVVAWSWEHCFNIAFDVIGQDYNMGEGGLIPKLALAVVIPLVMLPTYVQHIRARVLVMHGLDSEPLGAMRFHGEARGHGAQEDLEEQGQP